MAHSHWCLTGHYCWRLHSYWRRHWWRSCCYYYCHCYYYLGLAQREEQGEQWAEPAAQQASPSVAMGPGNCQRLATPLFSLLRCTRHSHGTHQGKIRSGYLTPAVSGSPSASERGTKSEAAHKWARWLLNPCRLGEPHRIRAGD